MAAIAQRMRGRNWKYIFIKSLHDVWDSIVLFENRLRLVINVNSRATTKIFFFSSIIILRKKRKIEFQKMLN